MFQEVRTFQDQKPFSYLEGGDVLVLSRKTIFVGLSQRSNPQGIEQLAEYLFTHYPEFQNLVAISIPKTHASMHLDTLLTQMDHHKFAIDVVMSQLVYDCYVVTRKNTISLQSKILPLLQKYVSPKVVLTMIKDNIVAAKSEQWNDGVNCLAVKPGVVITYNRNKVMRAAMHQAGVRVIPVPSCELSRGRGGPRCMSMPLVREDL